MNEEQAKQALNERLRGMRCQTPVETMAILNIIWQACCEWRDSQAGEPVAFTNAYQLAYLKDPKYSTTPMAMWAKPFNEAAIALYLARPTAQINQQMLEALDKLHAVVIAKNRAGADWGDQFTDLMVALSLAQAALAATQMRGDT